jgi:hypothetical protein
MTTRFTLALLGWAVAGLCLPAAATAGERVLRNSTHEMSDTLTFTYWVDYERYAVLTPEQEKALIADPVVRAPAGVQVTVLSLTVRKEWYETPPSRFIKGEQTVQKYERYVITGRWKVAVGKTCPTGAQSVSITFPNVAATAVAVGAEKHVVRGGVLSSVSLPLEVFADQAALDRQLVADRAAEEQRKADDFAKRWPEYLILVLLWCFVGGVVLFVLVTLVRFAFIGGRKRPRPSSRPAHWPPPDRPFE